MCETSGLDSLGWRSTTFIAVTRKFSFQMANSSTDLSRFSVVNSLCSFLPPLLLIVKRIPFTELRPCRHCTRHVICLILKRSHPSKSPSSLFGIPMVLVINFSHFSDNSNRFLISSGTHDDGNGSIWLEVKDTQLTMAQTRRLSYILIIQLKTQINLERDFLLSFFWWRLH